VTGAETMEAFFIRLVDGAPPDATEAVADHVALLGGLVLMATGHGSLVVALPREAKDVIAGHSLVALIGGVTLSNEGAAAEALRQRFAANAARQLAHPGSLTGSGSNELDPQTAGQIGRFPVASVRPEPERSPT
jgi:hypothetical protein